MDKPEFTPELLSKREIDIIVTVALDIGANRVLKLDWDNSSRDAPALNWYLLPPNEMGPWLQNYNIETFEAFTGEIVVEEEYEWERVETPDDPLAMLKLLNHFIFHSCAVPGWYFSDQREFCNQMISWIFREIPGYEEAIW